jgi:hypothetical protein
MDRAVQWLDFLVYNRQKKEFGVLLIHPYNGISGLSQRVKEALYAKEKYLTEKNIRYVILSKQKASSQVYQVLISRMFIK